MTNEKKSVEEEIEQSKETETQEQQEDKKNGATNEQIAQEMALSKFRRLMEEEQARSNDPIKYAKLDPKTKIIIVLIILLLLAGVIFTVYMQVQSGKEKKKDEKNTVQAEAVVSEEDSQTNQPEQTSTNDEKESENHVNQTGNLSEHASTYEGRKGTGEYNYGEALQKSILFYELQRSGDLPEQTRCNWRGDSALDDGKDAGLDLSGGLYDAGDHVKFNLPMAYTASTLAWSCYEDKESYQESGQLPYLLDTLRWINDYLIKCHPEKDVFYYQVGDGSADHSWWGPAEVMNMNRPSYKVDRANPGSAVSAQAAAALASASVVFEKEDKAYAALCLQHAKELYEFAFSTKSDAGYVAANGFYNSHSGFYDELAWAGMWLYLATEDTKYLEEAKASYEQTAKDYKWMYCWDDVSLGAALLLAKETNDRSFAEHVEKCLDYWTTGVNGERITYTPKGLAWLDSWGALRYSTTAAFVAAVYSDTDVCTASKKEIYFDFALAQVNYALGSTGFSYQIGFGDAYPVNPHHRTAQGSYANNMNEPAKARHTLYGALVGGPDSNDAYNDEVSNYVNNEVACDYNAGFTGALARMYREYGGETLVDFGAVEESAEDEICIEAAINTQGNDHTEVKAYVMNRSAWPARTMKNVSLRYFIDLSELYAAGKSIADVKLSTNYSQGGTASGILPWDEKAHIYYAEISFGDTPIYPGGQDSYKKEVQFRITATPEWNPENDYSYRDISGTSGNALKQASHMALYENGILVYGNEPSGDGKNNEKAEVPKPSETPKEEESVKQPESGAATTEGEGISLKVENQSSQGSGSTISVFFTIKNTGKNALSLSELKLDYYFTKDSDKTLQFWCDHSAISGSGYVAVTESVKGEFHAISDGGKHADTNLSITSDSALKIKPGDEWTIQVRVAKEDWSEMNFSNDYSAFGAEKIAVYYRDMLVSGSEP